MLDDDRASLPFDELESRFGRADALDPNDDRVVYFIWSPEASAIKLGVTRWLNKRFEIHQVSSPFELRLLGTLNGGLVMERRLKSRFASSRMRGEWFKEEILADVVQLLQDEGRLAA